MFCKKCGNKLTENDRFCKKCGSANDRFIKKKNPDGEESFSNYKEEIVGKFSDKQTVEEKLQVNNGIIKEEKNQKSNIYEEILEEDNDINDFEETLRLNADEINKESNFQENINNENEEIDEIPKDFENKNPNNNSFNEDLIPKRPKKSMKKIIIGIVSVIMIVVIAFLSIYFVQRKGYISELKNHEKKIENLVLDEEESKEINRLIVRAEDVNGLYTKSKKNEKLNPIEDKIKDLEKSSLERCEKLIKEIGNIEISEESKLSLKIEDKIDKAKNDISKGKYRNAYEDLMDLKDSTITLEKLSKENKKKEEEKAKEEKVELENKESNTLSINNSTLDAVADYLNGMVSALNTGDYSYVSPFIISGSPANTAQANYIKKPINEELLGHSIVSEKDVDSTTKDIVVIEEYNIINASDGYHYRKNQGTYRFKIDSDNYWKLHSFPAKVKVLEKR